MGYEISYKGMDGKAAEEKAINDVAEYLGSARAYLFADLVQLATCIEHKIPCQSNDGSLRLQKIQGLNMTFGFAGITGFPFHAFAKRYYPKAYAEWIGEAETATSASEGEEA